MGTERRKQFTFYASYFDAVMSLPKRRQWPTMLALIRYALEAAEPREESLYSRTAFVSLRPNIDSSRVKAEAKLREKREQEAGSEDRLPAELPETGLTRAPRSRRQPEKKNENQNKSESEKEREEENKQEPEKKSAPVGARTGAEPQEALSPALSEREALKPLYVDETAKPGSRPAEEGPTAPDSRPAEGSSTQEDPDCLPGLEPGVSEAREPYAAMLRGDRELARVWEVYRQRGSDGAGPPSEAEKLVVLCRLSGLPPRHRASNLRARLARSG